MLARLEFISPALSLPSESSAYNILKRCGLIRSRRRGKAKFDRRDRQLTIAKGPNELWAADYKGQIFTRKDRYVFPLTVTDLFSRYLLRLERTPMIDAWGARARVVCVGRALRTISAGPDGILQTCDDVRSMIALDSSTFFR